MGTMQNFAPTSTRTLERLREIANSGGGIIEIVPGVTDYTLELEHVELYNASLLEVLGYANLVDIQKITVPIDIVETCHHPDGTTKTITYAQCWPNSSAKTVTTRAITIVERCTMWPTRIL
jgi:hypothetical protein